MIIRGGCLCGRVCFQVEPPFERFANCHCSRCQKATGTAHSTNAVVRPSAFRWLQGRDLVVRYDLSSAQSFATAFCRTCGSPMPHLTRNGKLMIVPAGAFDDPLTAAPDRHMHWTSRANWYAHGEQLPLME